MGITDPVKKISGWLDVCSHNRKISAAAKELDEWQSADL